MNHREQANDVGFRWMDSLHEQSPTRFVPRPRLNRHIICVEKRNETKLKPRSRVTLLAVMKHGCAQIEICDCWHLEKAERTPRKIVGTRRRSGSVDRDADCGICRCCATGPHHCDGIGSRCGAGVGRRHRGVVRRAAATDNGTGKADEQQQTQ